MATEIIPQQRIKQNETTKKWIAGVKEKYGDIYNYDLVNYTGNKNHVEIVCSIHGVFKRPARDFIESGCVECGKINRGKERSEKEKIIFIENAKKIHGEKKYDYSQVVYKNNKTKVNIICSTHGVFAQAPHDHTGEKECGCPKCGMMKNRGTRENWLNKVKNEHPQRFSEHDYSKFVYVDCNKEAIFTCIKCNEDYLQTPNNHLRRTGCRNCVSKVYYNTESWINLAKEDKGHKYLYNEVVYVDQRTPVKIKCIHHDWDFWQTPEIHVNSKIGCPKCAKNYSYTNVEWIAEANVIHDKKYTYENVDYKTSKEKVNITCPTHGSFWQKAGQHIRGYGCAKCARSYHYTEEEYVEKAKSVHQKMKNKLDYSVTKYVSSTSFIDINCTEHGIFKIRPSRHLAGHGCPKCNLCTSCELFRTKNNSLCSYCIPLPKNKQYQRTKEMKIVRFLKDNLPDYEFLHNVSVGSSLTGTHLFPDIRFDCDDYQVIVEIDEFGHTHPKYECDKKRMYDIMGKLFSPCIFIRYNPDNKKAKLTEQQKMNTLLKKVKLYLNLEDKVVWNEDGIKVDYLFY